MNDVQSELVKLAVDPSVSDELLNHALLLLKGRATDDHQSKQFLSESEACTYCGGIARSTLWNWRRKGLVSYPVGGRRLYRRSDLDAFIVSVSA